MAVNNREPVSEGFRLEDILDELERSYGESLVARRPPNTWRSEEIREILRGLGLPCGPAALRRRRDNWIKSGLCTPIMAPHENAWGTVQTVPMLRFVSDDEMLYEKPGEVSEVDPTR